jgi:hypothetical protein
MIVKIMVLYTQAKECTKIVIRMFPNDARKILFHFSYIDKYFVSHSSMQYNLHRFYFFVFVFCLGASGIVK